MTENLTISIDSDSRKWAVFAGVADLKHAFTPYGSEDAALTLARAWCKANGDEEPQVVYPRITSMRVYSRAARGRKSASAA